jgi:phenylacetate-coenzyme A ligase PaaK-like adenylate-forming protein
MLSSGCGGLLTYVMMLPQMSAGSFASALRVGSWQGKMQEIIRGFLGTLRQTQFAQPEQILQYQRGLLERLIRHARTHVPFYREGRRLDPLFRRDGTIDWERRTEIPPLTRNDLQSSYDRLKSDYIPVEHGRTLPQSTAGSTGEPVKVLAQEMARRWAWAALRLRDFEWHRIGDDGSPAQPGEIGRILVTPFYNYIMPLIRYDHADFARSVQQLSNSAASI